MGKKFDEIYECVCPFCGDVGVLLYKSEYRPEFFCECCKVEYTYKSGFRDRYTLDKWDENKLFCKKHKRVFEEESYCSKCKREENVINIKELKFTEKQLAFLMNVDDHWELNKII